MKEIRLCDSGYFLETVDKCKKYHLGIEVQAFHDLVKKNDESEEECKLRIDNNVQDCLSHLKCLRSISLHAPYWEMNVGSKIYEIVDVARKYYTRAYEIALKLNCTEIVVHNGYYPGTSYPPNWIKRAVEFWKEFLKDKDKKVTFCLENQFELDSEMIKKVIDGVNDKRLKACLDIGHAYANSLLKVEDWIVNLGERIAYYHLHNNHGKHHLPGYNDDEHLGLKEGTIDIKKVLECANKYSPLAIWNLESDPKYHEDDIEYLKSLGYIK